MHNVKTELKGKQSFLAAYDEQVAALTRRAAHAREKDGARRQTLAATQRTHDAGSGIAREAVAPQLFTSTASTMQSKLASFAGRPSV